MWDLAGLGPFDAGLGLFLAQEAVDGGGAYPPQFVTHLVRHGEPGLPGYGLEWMNGASSFPHCRLNASQIGTSASRASPP